MYCNGKIWKDAYKRPLSFSDTSFPNSASNLLSVLNWSTSAYLRTSYSHLYPVRRLFMLICIHVTLFCILLTRLALYLLCVISEDIFTLVLQVILFEIDCAIFYTNLHELFYQFMSSYGWYEKEFTNFS